MDNMEIKKIVAEKLTEGVSLSDIQKILASEYEISMTFLDLRILASELEQIDWAEVSGENAEKAKKEAQMESERESQGSPVDDGMADAVPDGGTVVEVSKLARPGSVANGSVKFASGASAEWVLDQSGRLALSNASGEPTQDDIKDFQLELQKALAGGV